MCLSIVQKAYKNKAEGGLKFERHKKAYVFVKGLIRIPVYACLVSRMEDTLFCLTYLKLRMGW